VRVVDVVTGAQEANLVKAVSIHVLIVVLRNRSLVVIVLFLVVCVEEKKKRKLFSLHEKK